MPELNIEELRDLEPFIVCLGSHPSTIQALLDFDYLLGRDKPSVKVIIATGRKHERYFFGKKEIVIPVLDSVKKLSEEEKQSINLFINLVSARRILSSSKELISIAPNLSGGVIFGERLPEKHALELYETIKQNNLWILGGASVGLVIPGKLKLGAIGGVDSRQFEASNLFAEGQVAVISSSGGMVNEIIRQVADTKYGVSFALAVGGERFPITSPKEAMLSAEADPNTKAIAYFGELGGTDEADVADLLRSGKVTKPIVAYIAGTVAELFDTPPQFGHAKAMAGSQAETARAKRELLKEAGAKVGDSFADFINYLRRLDLMSIDNISKDADDLQNRSKGLIASSLSYDENGDVKILGKDILDLAENSSFAAIVISMLLGKQEISKETENFTDFVLRLLVDHGPYVSGAMNTIVTARAGRDLVSALSAGLLTIGPRFGGAINEAAVIWLKGVKNELKPSELVEDYASRGEYISGIGHRKYRVDMPDPRVTKVLSLIDGLKERKFTNFAKSVEAETLQKKGNLILNIDGAIAAGLLDVLHECEGYDYDALAELTTQEFFNALFVLSRSVGLMAHFFDQKRLDEGLFRLSDDQVTKL